MGKAFFIFLYRLTLAQAGLKHRQCSWLSLLRANTTGVSHLCKAYEQN